MKYEPLNSELFKLNRTRFTRAMKPKSIAIFHSNDMMPRNGDAYHDFRQNSDLFGLCGLDQEETVIVLFPDCIKEKFREVAFIRETNDHIKVWEGYKYTKEEARDVSGIETIYWTSDMDHILNELILMAETIYINTNENDKFSSEVPSRDARFTEELKRRYPAHNFERSQLILKQLAMIKSKHEVNAIQKACDITKDAFERVLRFVQPGVAEYEIEAEIIHEFIRQRATGHAYHPIIASGKNACILHYGDNNQVCKDGDVILMDFGAEYANYNADLTRSIPVNGQFTDRQRRVYNAVLSSMRFAKTMLVPGTNMEDYNKEVGKFIEGQLLDLSLLDKTDIKNQNPDYPAYKKYFMHGTSHHLGLDVHDLGDRYAPMQAGMVFTCEPGIYIPEESLGIRLENDILVTDSGPIDLMATIPLEADEIEIFMNDTILV
ncbi:MAG: aminopeptidase P family protein [Bacteroidia bacterium]|nr:aminopeptidase P family protein [Bacteroidia bacterium]